MIAATPMSIPGLADADQAALSALVNQLSAKSARNALRRRYYDHKNALRDLGIAIPPSLRTVETVVGWPAKSVDVLARRVYLEGFYLAGGGEVAPLGVDVLVDENRILTEFPQATTSALIHSAAFLTVTAGDVAAGEPEAIVMARSAQYATGIWDARRRGLSSGLSIVSVDKTDTPDHMVLYLPNRAVIIRKDGARWDLRQSVHDLGIPMEPMPFRPELDRPFGHSRISRAVMALTDSAVRTLLRTEVSAEFFAAPQRYALGADGETFIDADGAPIPAWQAIIGRLLAIGRDEDGNVPTVGQFAQQSMAPHIEQMRSLASLLAAESDLMPDTLGVIQDNPSSAEAIDARKEELRLTAESCISTFGGALERTMRRALRTIDDSPAARAEYARLRSRFRNPATPSMAAAADATVKLVGAGVLSPTSEVTYDGMNFTEDQRETLRAEARQARSTSLIAGLASAAGAPDAVAV